MPENRHFSGIGGLNELRGQGKKEKVKKKADESKTDKLLTLSYKNDRQNRHKSP